MRFLALVAIALAAFGCDRGSTTAVAIVPAPPYEIWSPVDRDAAGNVTGASTDSTLGPQLRFWTDTARANVYGVDVGRFYCPPPPSPYGQDGVTIKAAYLGDGVPGSPGDRLVLPLSYPLGADSVSFSYAGTCTLAFDTTGGITVARLTAALTIGAPCGAQTQRTSATLARRN